MCVVKNLKLEKISNQKKKNYKKLLRILEKEKTKKRTRRSRTPTP